MRRKRLFFFSSQSQVLHMAFLYDDPDAFIGPILLKDSGVSSAPQSLHSFSACPPQTGGGGGQDPAPSEPEAPGLGGVDGEGG